MHAMAINFLHKQTSCTFKELHVELPHGRMYATPCVFTVTEVKFIETMQEHNHASSVMTHLERKERHDFALVSPFNASVFKCTKCMKQWSRTKFREILKTQCR
eukprot:12424510-Karenia_brevis.AAC.1